MLNNTAEPRYKEVGYNKICNFAGPSSTQWETRNKVIFMVPRTSL